MDRTFSTRSVYISDTGRKSFASIKKTYPMPWFGLGSTLYPKNTRWMKSLKVFGTL